MPLTYAVSLPDRLIRVTAVGDVTVTENESLARELEQEPSASPGMRMLVDISRSATSMTNEHLRSVARRFRSVQAHGIGPVAIVAGSDFTYGMARAYSAYAEIEGIGVRVFRTEDDALAWLDTDPR